MSKRMMVDVPPERWAEIQTILHLYSAFFEVNRAMGLISISQNNAVHNNMARMAANTYYLDTFMGLISKGTPKEKMINPRTISEKAIGTVYSWWENYVLLLFDKEHGLLSYEMLEKVALLFAAGPKTSHDQRGSQGYPEFLSNTIKGE